MKKFCTVFALVCQMLCFANISATIPDSELIIVNKNNVVHKFVPRDTGTDHFTRNVFQNWENETFAVFEKVKDKDSVAIDIGAWIGTTSIWLSKNFKNVIAVEADRESLKCLKDNLSASECPNVSICQRPVMDLTKKVVFGPRGSTLNESISYIKDKSDNPQDYCLQSITFKQLLHDYFYENEALSQSKISFIKCDIEGGEENLLEDVMHFAYNNNCKVYMSFHLSWWKEKNIDDLKYLFSYFKSDCPAEDVAEYVKRNPFTSILFEPIDAGVLVKKNVTAVIIGYNQFTYIKNMVEQLEKYTNDIVVIDNNSTFQPLLDYYQNDFKYTLLKKKVNHGYTVYLQQAIQSLVGDVYILTDPDLKFNALLPSNFINQLLDVSAHFKSARVGFALLVDAMDIREDVKVYGETIKEWESRFWKTKLEYSKNASLELYEADLDTTFCLINRKQQGKHVRVAGDFTCVHLPWHKNYQDKLIDGERDSILKNNISSNWY